VSHFEVSDSRFVNLYHGPRLAAQGAALSALPPMLEVDDKSADLNATIFGNMDVSVDLGERCDSARRQLFQDEESTSKR
jgi:hypothetical protein